MGRYHPGIVAQASAYIARMYPGRFFLGLGTGEAMNEEPLGFPWTGYRERAYRLSESIRIIRRLWESDFVNFRGKHFRLNGANIYSKPNPMPEIFVAANGPKSAALAGRCADGMITFEAEDAYYRQMLFPALVKGEARARRLKPGMKAVQLVVSYDKNRERALQSCRRWAGALTTAAMGIRDPRKLDRLGRRVNDQAIAKSFVVCSSAEEMADRVGRYFDIGFDHVVLLDSSPDPRGLLDLIKGGAFSQLFAK